jgi:thiamine-phosphate pyrophosphorylase
MNVLLYYISDRMQFDGSEADRRSQLLQRIEQAASAGVDYIQLREKDLRSGDMEKLATEALRRVRDASTHTRLLINSRIDIALATGLDGVHLTSTDINPGDARAIHARARTTAGSRFMVASSCHTVAEVRLAESHGADFVVLAPIFEKVASGAAGIGLAELRSATLLGTKPDLRVEAGDHRVGIPVLALGGITVENAAACLQAGAAGVAGIRLFQQGDVAATVRRLREMAP